MNCFLITTESGYDKHSGVKIKLEISNESSLVKMPLIIVACLYTKA